MLVFMSLRLFCKLLMLLSILWLLRPMLFRSDLVLFVEPIGDELTRCESKSEAAVLAFNAVGLFFAASGADFRLRRAMHFWRCVRNTFRVAVRSGNCRRIGIHVRRYKSQYQG